MMTTDEEIRLEALKCAVAAGAGHEAIHIAYIMARFIRGGMDKMLDKELVAKAQRAADAAAVEASARASAQAAMIDS